MLSLRALDQEFTGKLQGWSAAGRELFRIGKIDAGIRREIEWLELFGKLIANTDMHLANLSVFEEDLRVTELTPVYDMLPMQYAPQNEQLVERDFQPAPPSPEEGDLWRDVCPAARDFWAAVSRHEKISKGFRGIARSNERKLVKLEKLTKLLPSSTGAP